MTQGIKRICVIISSNTYIRNYITSNALDDLKQHYDCLFLISKNATVPVAFMRKNTVKYFTPTSIKEHMFLFDLLMFACRHLSSSFKFRIRRIYFPKHIRPHWIKNLIYSYAYTKLRAFYRFFIWSLLILITLPGIRTITIALAKLRLKPNKSLREAMEEFSPDLILIPNSSYDPDGMDILGWSKNQISKVMFLIDNWDNLSSKSVLYENPDYMSVWGAQSVDHAKTIHNMDINRIFTLGTPRFDQYFELRNKKLESPFAHPYFLFVGTAVEFDEYAALKALNTIIDKRSEFKNHRIIYRPHPWRQSNDSFSIDDFNHVDLDPQIIEAFQSGDKKQQPDLKYYPALLQNSLCTVGGMTTMLIESLIMRTPFLALIWDDDKFITNMKDVFENYTHFRNTENISALYFNSNHKTLAEDLKQACLYKTTLNNVKLDGELEYFYTMHHNSFSERLINTIKKINI